MGGDKTYVKFILVNILNFKFFICPITLNVKILIKIERLIIRNW